jgi:hypothetical protein
MNGMHATPVSERTTHLSMRLALAPHPELSPELLAVAESLARRLPPDQALLAAGLDPSPAQVRAIAQHPGVQAAVARLAAELACQALLTRTEFLATLRTQAFADPAVLFEPGTWQLKPLHQWPEALRRCVTEIIPLKDGTTRVKLADRQKALELLGKARASLPKRRAGDPSSRSASTLGWTRMARQTRQSKRPRSPWLLGCVSGCRSPPRGPALGVPARDGSRVLVRSHAEGWPGNRGGWGSRT